MRLLIFSDSASPAGAEGAVTSTLRHLSEDFEVVVVCRSAEVGAAMARDRPSARVIEARRARDVLRALRASRPDIVHLNRNAFNACRAGLVSALILRRPVAIVDQLPMPGLGWRGISLNRLARRMGAVFVSVGPTSAREVEGHLRLPPGSVRSVPNGAEPSDDAWAPVPGGPLRAVFVGRLVPYKGAEVALRAICALEGVRLDIVGDGPARPHLERLAAALGATDRVTFAGWVRESERLLADHDVLVLPSAHEGLPFVLLEAMHRGIPVVATPVGSVPDLITPGVDGLLVPLGDVAALSSALRRLQSEPALAARLGAAARRTAMGFTARDMAAGYERLYREMAGVTAPTI